MQGTEIKIGVTIDDGGKTKKLTDGAGLLKKGYDDATVSATKLGSAVKAMAAPSSASKTMGALKGATRSPEEGIEYGQARAAVGTGAAGRDFAKQAQGLGGLVHVYATFAANLFAVSAAFTALRDAANTETMVKGLDQLGAASGRSLGALSKQLVETTGGAISLRDSMTAVAQASSAGLNNKQINDIAVVATKASNALGISMTDAISRLSRGISKIEPELLDELGIFVKIDEATSKYALSIGKTTNSLSEFERRQAFANAVLEQGKSKFAAIESAPNPYDKLLASVSNLATAGLELVNKVLVPVVGLLSSSPTALGLVFASIAGLLLKQAIPAVSNWRSELVKSAEVSAKVAKASYENFRDYSIAKALEQEGKLVGPLQSKLYKDMANAQSTLADTLSKKSKILAQAMTAGADPEKMARLTDTEVARRQTLLDKLKETATADKTASAAKKQAYDETIKKQEKEIANIQVANSLYKESIKTQTKIGEVQIGTENKKPSIMERMLGSISTRQENTAISKGILAQVGSDTQIKGISDAWKSLRENVKLGTPVFDESGKVIDRSTKGLEGLKAGTTLAKGGFLILGSAIGTALAAFSPWLELVGLLVAGFHILDSVLSKSTKEQEDFNTKIETTNSAVKTVTDTFDLYTKKSSNAFSIEAISAYTTALSGISDALDAQVLSFKKFNESAGDWDRLKDSIGKSNLDKLQASSVESVKGIVKALELSGNSQNAKGALAKVLFGADASPDAVIGSTKELSKAFDGLTKTEREEKINKIAEAIGRIREQEEYSTNAAKAFIESLNTIDKLVDQMIQANAFTDLQGKLGVELVQASDKLAQALMDPLKALEDIAKLGKDPKALAVLGGLDVSELAKAAEYTKKLSDAEKELGKTASDLEKAKSGQGKLAAGAREAAGAFQFRTFANQDTIRASESLDVTIAQKAAEKARKDLENLKKEGAAFALSQTKLITDIADAGFVKIELGLKRAKELADISVSRTALSVASSLGADTSSQEYKLKLQEIDIQKSLIEASYNAEIATNKNTEELSYLNARLQQDAATALKNKDGATVDEKATADIMAKSAQRILASIEAKKALKSDNSSEAEVTRIYGKEAVLSAKSAIKTEQLPGIKKESAVAMANAQAASALIEKQSKELEFQARKAADKNTVEKEGLTIQQELLNIATQLNSYSSTSLIDIRSATQQKLLESDVETKIAKINSDQARLDLDKVKNSIVPEEYKRLSELNAQRLKNINTDKQVKTLAIDINNIRDKSAAKQTEINEKAGIAAESARIQASLQEANIAQLQKEIDGKVQLGTLDEQSSIRMKADLELQSQSLKYAQEQAKLANDVLLKQNAVGAAKKAVEVASTATQAPGATAQTFEVLSQAQAGVGTAEAQLANAKLAIETGKQTNQITVDSIKNNAELNLKLAEQRDHLANIASLTDNLSTVFGNFGKSLGGVISAFDTLTTNQEKRAAQEQQARADLEAGVKTREQYDAVVNKGARAELDDQAKVAGNAKKLFKEKTTAYKTLDGLEKIRSAQSIALSFKEFAIKSGLLKQEQLDELAASAKSLALKASDALKSIGIDIPAIYAKFMATMGPWGAAAAGAAIAAFVGGAFGGGGSSAPFVPTAEQRQETQGTAMSYDNAGNKVQTSRGVFGDTSAKSESIANSLEIIKDNSVKGLDYDDKMLRSLQNLTDALDNTAKGLYGVKGLRAGSLTGVVEGTNSGGGLLGIGGLFSKSVTKSIVDSGLQLKGTFLELVQGVKGTINTFETVSTTVKRSGLFGIGGGTSTSVNTAFADLNLVDPKSFKALVNAFGYASDLLYEVADTAGKDASAVTVAMSKIRVDQMASLRGLTGEQFTSELSAVIGNVLDETSLVLFAEFEKFANFGEGMLETVIRVIDTNKKVLQQLSNLSVLSVIGLSTGTSSMQITENLAKLAGGLDKFLDQSNYFADNFLTEGERVIPVQKAVIKQLANLGYASVDTKAEFKTLVQSLDVTTDAGQQTYQSLMDLAPGFVEIIDLVDSQSQSLKDAATGFREFSKSLLEFKSGLLLGTSNLATPTEKYLLAKAELDATYTKALAGDKDAQSKFQSAATTFLDSSKVVNASSQAYQTDFNSVLSMIDTASISALASADVAQLQLDALSIHTTLLTSINANIATIAGVPQAAGGGRVSGLTMVGELGPELVDFSTPGRVYTADQTAGMFTPGRGSQAMGAVVTELQQLRQEVAQLRKDQQRQTGDLIISNYDANQKASQEIATAVVESSQDVAWMDRSKSEIK